MTERASDYLYSWNVPATECLKHVRIEDDTRDALQSAHVTRPSLQDRKELQYWMVEVTFEHLPIPRVLPGILSSPHMSC